MLRLTRFHLFLRQDLQLPLCPTRRHCASVVSLLTAGSTFRMPLSSLEPGASTKTSRNLSHLLGYQWEDMGSHFFGFQSEYQNGGVDELGMTQKDVDCTSKKWVRLDSTNQHWLNEAIYSLQLSYEILWIYIPIVDGQVWVKLLEALSGTKNNFSTSENSVHLRSTETWLLKVLRRATNISTNISTNDPTQVEYW